MEGVLLELDLIEIVGEAWQDSDYLSTASPTPSPEASPVSKPQVTNKPSVAPATAPTVAPTTALVSPTGNKALSDVNATTRNISIEAIANATSIDISNATGNATAEVINLKQNSFEGVAINTSNISLSEGNFTVPSNFTISGDLTIPDNVTIPANVTTSDNVTGGNNITVGSRRLLNRPGGPNIKLITSCSFKTRGGYEDTGLLFHQSKEPSCWFTIPGTIGTITIKWL